MWTLDTIEARHIRDVMRIHWEARREFPYHYAGDLASFEAQYTKFVEPYMEGVRANGYPTVAAIVDGKLVGFAYAAGKGEEHASHVAAPAVQIAEQWRGLGVGPDLLKALIDRSWAAGIDRLEAEVYSHNIQSLKMTRKCGFIEEGVKRMGHVVNGTPVDVVLLAMLSPRFRNANHVDRQAA